MIISCLGQGYPRDVQYTSKGLSIANSVMGKFAYLRGNYQKLLRKVEKKLSGSAWRKTPKWEYFKALSFFHPVYSSSRNESSFTNEDLMFEGSFEEADLPVAPTLPATTTVLSTTETPSLSIALSLSSPLSIFIFCTITFNLIFSHSICTRVLSIFYLCNCSTCTNLITN
ncbi:hypothetical protein E2C01_067347 [Portunus trituberculatus]|uniref:MADF domain-containing protein n=1 Tax=Portunus trituberculatus TaxID=210409 RepID=A0A5B7HJJ6_PORTR|nr:hypothetical protein [Portunus trituberculatus]